MAQLPQRPKKLAALERWSWSFYGTTSSDTKEVGCIREVVVKFLWNSFFRDPTLERWPVYTGQHVHHHRKPKNTEN